MDVFQGPDCDLRFRSSSELEDHLATEDHPPVYGPDIGALDRHAAAPATREGGRDAAPASLHVRHLDHDRFSIRVRGHEVVVDQPRADGGDDSGPTPTELYVASLASCVAFYGSRFMRRHAIPGAIEVTARWTMGKRPARVEAIELDVLTPPIPSDKRERFSSVIERCTVHNSFVSPPDVSIGCVGF